MAAEPRPAPERRRPPWLALGLLALALAGAVVVFIIAEDNRVLVAAPPGQPSLQRAAGADVDQGDEVLVRGVVRRLGPDASDALVNPSALEEFEGDPFIAATEVRPAGDVLAVRGAVELEEIASDGERFIGRQVTVVAPVANDLGGRFFTLEGD